nr:YetF domain-containing protein [Lysobacter antarcticus]
MLYPELSIGYAALVLVGVTLLTIGIEKSASHSRKLRDYLESRPCVLVQDGEIDVATMKRERTTRRELYAILRQNGARALSQVELAILEVTGDITVVLNDSKPEKRDLIDYLKAGNTGHAPAVPPAAPS